MSGLLAHCAFWVWKEGWVILKFSLGNEIIQPADNLVGKSTRGLGTWKCPKSNGS
jgi:hypothetical protein